MTIDRIISALKGAVYDTEQCLVELEAKVEDLEIDNQRLNEDLNVANDDVSALQTAAAEAQRQVAMIDASPAGSLNAQYKIAALDTLGGG